MSLTLLMTASVSIAFIYSFIKQIKVVTKLLLKLDFGDPQPRRMQVSVIESGYGLTQFSRTRSPDYGVDILPMVGPVSRQYGLTFAIASIRDWIASYIIVFSSNCTTRIKCCSFFNDKFDIVLFAATLDPLQANSIDVIFDPRCVVASMSL